MTRGRLLTLAALWLAAYLVACVAMPEPDDTPPVLCDDGTPPTPWCGCEPPLYGDDC